MYIRICYSKLRVIIFSWNTTAVVIFIVCARSSARIPICILYVCMRRKVKYCVSVYACRNKNGSHHLYAQLVK